MTLFDPGPEQPIDRPSRDARRTIRQREQIRLGRHPVARIPLADNGETCGTCTHAYRTQHGRRSYWKCDLVEETNGPGTDLRISWPACIRWQADIFDRLRRGEHVDLPEP